MKRIFLFTLLLLIPFLVTEAKGKVKYKLLDPLLVLDKATGHMYDDNLEWVTLKQNIYNFDFFKSWSIGYVEAKFPGEKTPQTHVYLQKEWDTYVYRDVWREKILFFEESDWELVAKNEPIDDAFLKSLFVLDWESYQEQLEQVSEVGENYLEIKLLHVDTKRKKNKTKAELVDDMSFIMRFRLDSIQNKVKYLFYTSEGTELKFNTFNMSDAEVQDTEVYMKDVLTDLCIRPDALDWMWYETDYDTFITFIRAPIEVLKEMEKE